MNLNHGIVGGCFAEDFATGAANSDVLDLPLEQISRVKELVEQRNLC